MLYFSHLLANKRFVLIERTGKTCMGWEALKNSDGNKGKAFKGKRDKEVKGKICQNEKAELFERGVEDYGVCMVHMPVGGSQVSAESCCTHWSPKESMGWARPLAGWWELAGLLDWKDGAAARGRGKTEQLRCGSAGRETHVILHIG